MALLRSYSCVIIFILCSLYLGNVLALKCYQTQPDNTVQEKTCETIYNACMKTVSTTDSATAVIKGCTLWNDVMNCTSVSTEVPKQTTEFCRCNNVDLCNSAGKTHAYSLMGFGVVAAVLYRLI